MINRPKCWICGVRSEDIEAVTSLSALKLEFDVTQMSHHEMPGFKSRAPVNLVILGSADITANTYRHLALLRAMPEARNAVIVLVGAKPNDFDCRVMEWLGVNAFIEPSHSMAAIEPWLEEACNQASYSFDFQVLEELWSEVGAAGEAEQIECLRRAITASIFTSPKNLDCVLMASVRLFHAGKVPHAIQMLRRTSVNFPTFRPVSWLMSLLAMTLEESCVEIDGSLEEMKRFGLFRVIISLTNGTALVGDESAREGHPSVMLSLRGEMLSHKNLWSLVERMLGKRHQESKSHLASEIAQCLKAECFNSAWIDSLKAYDTQEQHATDLPTSDGDLRDQADLDLSPQVNSQEQVEMTHNPIVPFAMVNELRLKNSRSDKLLVECRQKFELAEVLRRVEQSGSSSTHEVLRKTSPKTLPCIVYHPDRSAGLSINKNLMAIEFPEVHVLDSVNQVVATIERLYVGSVFVWYEPGLAESIRLIEGILGSRASLKPLIVVLVSGEEAEADFGNVSHAAADHVAVVVRTRGGMERIFSEACLKADQGSRHEQLTALRNLWRQIDRRNEWLNDTEQTTLDRALESLSYRDSGFLWGVVEKFWFSIACGDRDAAIGHLADLSKVASKKSWAPYYEYWQTVLSEGAESGAEKVEVLMQRPSVLPSWIARDWVAWCLRIKDYSSAMKILFYWSKVAEATDDQLMLMCGQFHVHAGDFKSAQLFFLEACAISPDNYRNVISLARNCLELHLINEAEALWDAAAKLPYADLDECKFGKAQCLYAMRRLRQADELLMQLSSLPHLFSQVVELAQQYRRQDLVRKLTREIAAA